MAPLSIAHLSPKRDYSVIAVLQNEALGIASACDLQLLSLSCIRIIRFFLRTTECGRETAKSNMSRPKDDGAANRTSKPDVMEDVDPEKMRFINGSEEIYPNDNVTVKIPDEKEIDAATFSGLTKQELMVFADDPFWTKIRNVLMLVFWVFWFGMLISAVLIIIFTPGCPVEPQMTWLQEAKVYQIFPRSFLDTDHDGIGDIKGKST